MQHEVNTVLNRLYKSESSKLIAVLIRVFGPENIDLAEDTLQDAFNRALHNWREHGIPPKPAAWLMQTAKNRAIDIIRANKNALKFSADLSRYLESEWSLSCAVESEFKEEKIQDDQLRMMFMCCREDLSVANQIPLLLKLLCGFSTTAVSRALLIPEATVKKRLLRTRQQLKGAAFDMPPPEKMSSALNTVHTVIYLLFNEGFHSSGGKEVINRLFCMEALGLAKLLIETPAIANRDTYSLLALLNFHMARLDSRLDEQGQAIPLDMQDRRLWSKELVIQGDALLAKAREYVQDDANGRFFYEALIAREHCQSTSFDATNWPAIVYYYFKLIAITQSPLAMLNQAIAIAYSGSNELAIKRVTELQENKTFKNSHLPLATLAHLYAKAGSRQQAMRHAEAAMALGGTALEQALMLKQIERHLTLNLSA
ncbi:RNA polymerase sigma-70 factor, ECF subfamily [Alteromonadaceae bacterium Bs31]|nr:RNA polymerase sigma-70 factor, ECF subfamily [Alteromonadaceae bacterium Bs31]